MLENQMMLLAVFERAALMLMTLFFLTRTRPFQRLFQKRDHTPAELVLVAEFKLAERNLELPATLAARGLMALTKPRRATGANKTDGAALTDFMQKGGIEGLVHQCNAVVHERRPIFAGAAALLHLQHP